MKCAGKISRQLVKRKLAACVSLLPGIKSVYSWKGKIEQSDEVLLLIKSRKSLIKKLEGAIIELHPYETPEFVTFSTDRVNKRYLQWAESVMLR